MCIFSIGRVGWIVGGSESSYPHMGQRSDGRQQRGTDVCQPSDNPGAGTRLHNRPGLSRAAHKAHICIVTDTGEA